MNLEKIYGNKNIIKIAVILGVAGVLLIFLSDFLNFDNKTKTTEIKEITSADYTAQLEADIEQLTKGITGDRNVSAIVTLENGTEYIYATQKNVDTDVVENRGAGENYNNQTSDKSEESYIIINTGSGEQPLLLNSIAPKIRGVAVVCESGNLPEISDRLSNAICVLLDITESRVSISGIK